MNSFFPSRDFCLLSIFRNEDRTTVLTEVWHKALGNIKKKYKWKERKDENGLKKVGLFFFFWERECQGGLYRRRQRWGVWSVSLTIETVPMKRRRKSYRDQSFFFIFFIFFYTSKPRILLHSYIHGIYIRARQRLGYIEGAFFVWLLSNMLNKIFFIFKKKNNFSILYMKNLRQRIENLFFIFFFKIIFIKLN